MMDSAMRRTRAGGAPGISGPIPGGRAGTGSRPGIDLAVELAGWAPSADRRALRWAPDESCGRPTLAAGSRHDLPLRTYAVLDGGLARGDGLDGLPLVEACDFTGRGLAAGADGTAAALGRAIAGRCPGFDGADPEARLVHARIFDDAAMSDGVPVPTEATVRALRWAAPLADALVLARGTHRWSRPVARAVEQVVASGTVVLVAADRPDGTSVFPAGIPGVVSVGALGRDARPLRAIDADVLAPGENVVIGVPGGAVRMDGAPIATALAATMILRTPRNCPGALGGGALLTRSARSAAVKDHLSRVC